MTPEQILKNFNRCVDWEERYLYLIELGERLPPYPSNKLTDDYIVSGCQSQVWVYMSRSDQGLINIQATSDSSIVKGLLSLLTIAYDQQPLNHVLSFDIQAWFESLDLRAHLTPGRTQGLDSIIKWVITQTSKDKNILEFNE